MADGGGRWFERSKGFVAKVRPDAAPGEADDTPDLWTRCPGCAATLFNETLAEHDQVCPQCGHHFPLDGPGRVRMLCDEGSMTLHDADLRSVDVLGFVDSKPYDRRIAAAVARTGRNDAFVAASATIEGIPVEIGSMDFQFLGGSMGSVVGEAITRLLERARERRVPAIVISSSGGARMQEGVLSLMQMAKTSTAIARLKDEARMPYLSILTHPTTGGVAASFSMLGDVILAEPGALIGFAGPRVIKETIGQELPEGFQTSEYLLENGQIDLIVPRPMLRATIARLLGQLLRRASPDLASA